MAKISTEEKREFARYLLTLLQTGKPINECFETIVQQVRSSHLKKVAQKAKERTEKGTPMYEVFKADPSFEPAFSGYLRAGEEGGNLEKSLEFLIEWLDRKAILEREISSATLYPKIVFSVAILLGGGLTYFIFPRLIPIFGALNVELPLTSRVLLSFSHFVKNYGIFLFFGVLAFFILFLFLKRIKKVQITFDKIILKIPFFNDIIKHYQLTIFSQLTATLFESGLTITEILDILVESVPNYAYKESLVEAKRRIIRGDSFSGALNSFPKLYPYLFINLLATGEQTGSYGQIFSQLADLYSQELTSKVKKIGIILEPAILIILGSFIAFVASAIILPVYQMTKGFY